MKYFFLLFTLSFCFACTNADQPSNDQNQTSSASDKAKTTTQTDCKYGQPVAIFSDSLDLVSKQSFELIGQKGVETVTFSDGKVLELYQSGCNEIRQEYRFFLKGNYKDEADAFWFEKAVERLSFVGNLSERYAVIGLWVGALDRMIESMTIGQFTELEPNTFMMVDKIVEQESAMVIIVLERRI